MKLFETLKDFILQILPNRPQFQAGQTKEQITLTRAVWEKGQFMKSKSIPKPGLFLPRPNKQGELETSIANIQGMTTTQIWQYISENIRKGNPFKGRVDFSNNSVIKVGLKLRYDSKPKRHVAIVGWPAEKSEQKSAAIDLIEFTTLILKSD